MFYSVIENVEDKFSCIEAFFVELRLQGNHSYPLLHVSVSVSVES